MRPPQPVALIATGVLPAQPSPAIHRVQFNIQGFIRGAFAISSQVQQLVIYAQAVAGTGIIVFGLAAAALEWWSRLQRQEDQVKARDWWTERWCRLGDSGWFQLPYKVLHGFLQAFTSVSQRVHCYFRCAPPGPLGFALMLSAIVSGAVVLWQLLGWWSLLYCAVGVGLTLFGMGRNALVDLASGVWILFTSILLPLTVLHFLAAHSLPKALVLLILASPLLWVCLTFWGTACFVVRGLWRHSHGHAGEPQFMGSPYVETWALTATISFIFTTAAMLFGTAFDDSVPVPRSALLLFVNAVCDTLSLAALLIAVRWIMVKPSAARLALGVLAATGSAALLAILSVWIGLFGSANPLSLHQSLRVLVSLHPTSATISLGPLFWAMHTVFLPLLTVCVLLMLLLLAKGLLHGAHWFYGKAAVNEKPHHLVAGLMILLAAICTAVKFSAEALTPPAP